MQFVPGFTRLLASTAMAALFVALPVSAKFDLSGGVTFTSATAQAQDLPGDLPPGDGPGGPGDLPPDGGPGDLPPDGGPGDLPPDGGPIDPPPPPPGPIDLPMDPIKPLADGCEKVNSVDCVKPVPLVKAQNSDDRKDAPASLPVKPPVLPSAAEVAMDEAKTLRCAGPCRIQVNADGKITVDTGEFKTGSAKHFAVNLVLDGTTVTSVQTGQNGTILGAPTVKKFATRAEALSYLSSIVPTYS